MSESFVCHRGPVTCACEIPHSRSIITSGYDGAVALFDAFAADGRQVRLLGYHRHLVNRISVNAAGTLAASSSSDFTIYLWDLARGSVLRVLQGHDDDVEDFVFISDTLGASVSRDWRVILWDLASGAIVRVLHGHQKDVLSVSCFEGRLFTAGDDMTLRSWDIDSGRQLSQFGPFDTETDSCAVDAVNRRVILGGDDGHIRVFDIDQGEPLADIAAHRSGIKKVSASPLTGDILSAAYDQRIRVWDAHTLRLKRNLRPRPGLWERSFNWSPDGERIVAGTFDGTVVVWSSATGECLREIGGGDAAGNACFNELASTSGDRIVTVSDDGFVRLGSLGREQAAWQQKTRPGSGRVLMNAITYDVGQDRVIAGAHDQKLHIFRTQHEQLVHEAEISLDEGPINSIRIAAIDGYAGHLFVACYSGVIAHLDPHGRLIGKCPIHHNAVKALRLHPDRPLGVSCSADGALVSWGFDGKRVREYIGHTAIVDDVDIDPGGRLIASVGRDFVLKVHELDSGALAHSIHLGRRSPKSLCFLESDLVIVTNYWGELIRVDLADGRILRSTVAGNGISSIVRLEDDLAAASYDGAVYRVEKHGLTVLNCLREMIQQVQAPVFA